MLAGSHGGVPAVAVVVPAFNHGRFLAAALSSVLAQTVPVSQLVVVDDGSSDDTPAVLDRYPQLDRVRQENKGRPAARNVGLARVRGEYVAFLDADNELAPTFVERCLKALEEHPEAGFAYPWVERFGDDDEVVTPPPYDFELLKRGNYIDVCSLFRVEALRAYRFDESLTWGWEDWDLFLGLGERGVRGVLVAEPLVRYRVHPGQLSAWLDASPCRWRRLRLQIVRRHPTTFGRGELARSALRLAYRCSLERLGRWPALSAAPGRTGSEGQRRRDRGSD